MAEVSDTLRYSLAARERYRRGQALEITFSIANTSEEAAWVLTWYTPFEPLAGDIFRITCNGREIAYNGRMVKRGEPEAGDYIFFAPHEERLATVVLDAAYDFSRASPGMCEVDFTGKLHDVQFAPSLVVRKRSQHRGVAISGAGVAFVLE